MNEKILNDNQCHPLNIIRMLELAERFSMAKSSAYDRIANGLIAPGISLGGRSKGYLESEVNAVLKAMIAGKSEAEIKALVCELVKQRQDLV
ncbi:AlpA family phage regulatory protein [uncultured Psychromonas sp.]|uniref:helix-turn-helix transcriptional regulator n=1 Tax=uncultured Psychromonas sp. TaxID=173974 RepID=UPI0026298CB3|nr:AlpA family phage regulatory protein [uncultured Psychromonas sp.]